MTSDMLLSIKVTLFEEKTLELECVDYPAIGTEFVTFYLKDLGRKMVPTKNIIAIDTGLKTQWSAA